VALTAPRAGLPQPGRSSRRTWTSK
jgi:hypothetical protein